MPVIEQSHNHAFFQQALALFVCLTFFTLPIGTALFTIGSLIALAVWLFSGICYRDRVNWQETDWFVPLTALIILPWLGMLWTSAPLEQSFKLAVRSHYWILAFVSVAAMKSDYSLRNILICFISGTTVIAIIVFLFLHGFIPETVYLQKFLGRYYITFSLFLVISILLLSFFYKTSTWQQKLLLIALMLFLALAITQLKGRSAYLSLAFLSPWLFVTMFGRRRLIPVLAALLLTFMLMLSSSMVRERVALIPKEILLYQSGVSSSYQSPDGSSTPSSVGLRLMMWKNALTIFQQHPLIGAGTAGYQYEAEKIDPTQGFSHPHSSYLFIAVNYGLLGIGLYGWLLFVTLKRAWRARDQLSGYSILAFLSVILIGSLTDTQILSPATGIALGFIVGIPTTKPT
ncbi:MAG: O-antigen ligase family protein [Steroidobacteraceae bacterium]|nr:O-antigen ligase family protein [Deltaproteobacteria bacterium]